VLPNLAGVRNKGLLTTCRYFTCSYRNNFHMVGGIGNYQGMWKSKAVHFGHRKSGGIISNNEWQREVLTISDCTNERSL